VNQAGETMDEVIGSVRQVSDIIAGITAASNEQAEGIALVNQAIAHMDGSTQQNASLVEEAAAAAQSLQNQAGELAQLVSVFRVDEHAVAPRLAAVKVTSREPAEATVKNAAQEATALAAPRRHSVAPPRRLAVVARTPSEGWEEF
jgi:methyl-accepting chemotaxis protein